jgi:hypothetical protein
LAKCFYDLIYGALLRYQRETGELLLLATRGIVFAAPNLLIVLAVTTDL